MIKRTKLQALNKDLFQNEEKWYVAVTRTNYEFKFKKDLQELVISHNLLDQVTDIFVPIKKFTVEYTNAQNKIANRVINEKILSLYVFFKAKMSEVLYGLISSMPSCMTLLTSGDMLSTLSEEEILNYRKQCAVNTALYKGKKIIKQEDPFNNPLFSFRKANLESLSKEQKILLNIYGNFKRLKDDIFKAQDLSLQRYRKKIIKKIYADEVIVSKYKAKEQPIRREIIFSDGHINFDVLNMQKMFKAMQKFSVDLDNIDETILKKLNINFDDILKLKRKVDFARQKENLQNQKKSRKFKK